MALADLLEDDVDVPEQSSGDLSAARAATYVFHNVVTYAYPSPIQALQHQFLVLPRRRHGDQRRITHRSTADLPRRATVRRRHDRFGNPVVEVRAAEVPDHFSFGVRAVLHRRRDDPTARPWRPEHSSSTRLTAADPAVIAAAAEMAHGFRGADVVSAIGEGVRAAMTYEFGVTGVRTTAGEAWRSRCGVCQDMAHVMIAMCRSRDLPARYVSGHLVGEGASHAWVEVRAEGRTIVYDPTHARETDLRYVTIAVGRDYRDVAPTAGTYRSGPRGTMTVHKRVAVAALD